MGFFMSSNTNIAPSTQEPLTKEQFIRALPKQFKANVSDELIQNINAVLGQPEMAENFRENLLSYTSVMSEGKFKIADYVNAVRYVSYKLLGSSNIDAYVKTFPDRYQNFLQNNVDEKDIASYVSAYNKTKLVNLILEQTLVPSWVLNQHLYQKALNVQAELMIHAKSEKVRSEAANSILNHLKRPETHKVELNVTNKEDKSIEELRQATIELARQQRMMIESGAMNAQEVAHSRVIQGEATEVSYD